MRFNKIIYKYLLNLAGGDSNKFDWPHGSKVLSLQAQDGHPVIWVEHPLTPPAERQKIHFWFAATGHAFAYDPITTTYVDTALLESGRVVHLFKEFEVYEVQNG